MCVCVCVYVCVCVCVCVCAKERAGKQNKVKFVLESTILRPKVIPYLNLLNQFNLIYFDSKLRFKSF